MKREMTNPKSGSTAPQRWSAVVGLLLRANFLIGCSNSSATRSPSITVAFSTLSGRPNPMWQPEEWQAVALLDILESLDPTEEAFNAMGLPPYAGFHLEIERGMITGRASRVDVYDGVILLLDKDLEQLAQLEDPDYKVETYLFETAEGDVEPAVYDRAFDRFRELTKE